MSIARNLLYMYITGTFDKNYRYMYNFLTYTSFRTSYIYRTILTVSLKSYFEIRIEVYVFL